MPLETAKRVCRYRIAAEQGHPKGQFDLGEAYAKGEGVLKDHVEAARWFRRAAEQGYTKAQCNLIVMYVLGVGVPQDDLLAHMWGSLARAQGVKTANNLMDALEIRM
ncbi:sel1 repeat family protein, partial [Alphaproteobacteria bacterium]|nr:sel1 repeat family protein [Alphaproteobacteria bacterium]